jgi:hypothetical protein
LLLPGTSYEWMVRCACTTVPLVVTAFSPLDTFTVPLALRQSTEPVAFDLYPNPVSHSMVLRMSSGTAGAYTVRIMDMLGRVRWEASSWNAAPGALLTIQAGAFPAGTYVLELRNENHVQRHSFVVQPDTQ